MFALTDRSMRLAALLLGLLLLAACAPAPVEPEAVPRDPADVELTLNIPAEAENCICETEPENDRTFLERGMETLAGGEYIEAVQYFQRYQRLEQTPLAQWEADLAIAYVSMLSRSPFYDADAAREVYVDLQGREPQGQKHPSIVLMQQALESFVIMERHIEDLEGRASMLQEDLNKREQALKRLRELTLGQPEDAP